MRFAYIDSNGNEVPIPSVDALALRIELGAISENTELYDAQADQWGPAHTHEIFHTLSRAAEEGDQGFVAPLPPLPEPPPAAEPEPEAEPAVAAEPEPEPPPPAKPEPRGADELGLSIADSFTDIATVEEEEAEATASGDVMDLSPAGAAEGNAPAGDGPEASFDFGDLDGGLQMESGFDEPADSEPMMDFGGSPGGFGDGLEQPMEFSSAGADAIGGGLDLEQPMSEFTAEDPPEWMEPADSGGGDEVMDFSSISSDSVATSEPGTTTRAQRTPKDRPSPPKFKRQRSVVGPIVGVVLLAAIGIGGYVLWPVIQSRLAGPSTGPTSEIVTTLPSLGPDLMPPMQAAQAAALASWFQRARSEVGDGPAGPPREWLAGVYLANASQFPGVEDFWLHVQDELDAVRELDDDAFEAEVEGALAAAGVAEADRAAIVDRAVAGFDAAREDRVATFRLVDEVVDAALGLHDFLVANEDNIEYTPAATVTSDPVLEAKPSIPEIGEGMEDRIDRVTSALDGLDYLDQVTAEGFWNAVLSRVQSVGVR